MKVASHPASQKRPTERRAVLPRSGKICELLVDGGSRIVGRASSAVWEEAIVLPLGSSIHVGLVVGLIFVKRGD